MKMIRSASTLTMDNPQDWQISKIKHVKLRKLKDSQLLLSINPHVSIATAHATYFLKINVNTFIISTTTDYFFMLNMYTASIL